MMNPLVGKNPLMIHVPEGRGILILRNLNFNLLEFGTTHCAWKVNTWESKVQLLQTQLFRSVSVQSSAVDDEKENCSFQCNLR